MKISSVRSLLVAAIATFVSSVSFAAPIVIDDFSAPTVSLTAPVNTLAVTTGGAASVLGGVRELAIQRTQGSSTGNYKLSAGGGVGSYANTPVVGDTTTVKGRASFAYDGTSNGSGATGGNVTIGSIGSFATAQNLYDGTNDRLQLSGLSFTGSLTVAIFVKDTDSSATFSFTNTSIPTNGEVLFTQFAGIDFTQITGLQLFFSNAGTDGISNADVSLTRFAATPEPSTFALAGIAALGLVIARRRRA